MKKNYSPRAVLIAAAWCGLVAGLLEGAAFLRFPLLRNPDLPWIAVLFDLAVFLALGSLFVLLARLLPGRAISTAANAVFFGLITYDCATVAVGDHSQRVILRVVALGMALALALLIWKFTMQWEALQRRSLAVLALFALLYTGTPPLRRALQERRELAQVSARQNAPNVLVIIVDALRADHLSTYGYTRATSPHLTSFAARGALFSNAIAPASWTLPSHASLLTGRLPHDHGVDRPDSYLGPRLPTLAEAFRSRGYRTAGFSANWWFFARRLGFGRGFMHFEDFNSLTSAVAQTNMGQRVQNLLLKLKLLGTALGRSRAPTMNRHILNWLDRSQGPFFVVANYMDVHEPYLPPVRCFHRFSRLARPRPMLLLGNPHVDHLTPEEVRDQLDAYDASIYCLDGEIASLEQSLAKRGLLENTILVFTSDHGDAFYEHRLMGHSNSLYRELIHVPLVMVGPGIPSAVTVERPVSLTWLPATLLTLVSGQAGPFPGVPLEQAWRTRDLRPWPDPVSELTAMYMDVHAPNYAHDLESVTTSTWHLILGAKSGEELYDYRADSRESNNLAGNAPAVVEVLKGELQQQTDATTNFATAAAPRKGAEKGKQDWRSPPASNHAPRRQRQRMNDYLKALGYAAQ